jgi:hypothetical protein
MNLLASCTAQSHSAVLDDFSCQTPCWRGISPGMTQEESYSRIKEMPDIDANSISSGYSSRKFWNTYISWKFINSDETNGGIFFRDDRVIFSSFTYFKEYFPLKSFLDKFGEPKEIVIEKGILDDVMMRAFLIYPEDGICLLHDPISVKGNPNKYSITPITTIKEIIFYDPQLSLIDVSMECLSEYDASSIQTWKGYGTYSVSCLNNDSRLCNW